MKIIKITKFCNKNRNLFFRALTQPVSPTAFQSFALFALFAFFAA